MSVFCGVLIYIISLVYSIDDKGVIDLIYSKRIVITIGRIGGVKLLNKRDIDYLGETLSFWKDLKDSQKDLIKEQTVIKEFSEGESMRGSSDNCAGLFLILKGQVRAYIISETGREISLYRLFERDVCLFTASCILKSITFDIFIEVEKPTIAYLIPTPIFRKISAESVAVQTFTNDVMASRFSDVMWIMEQALFSSLDKRLANLLVERENIEGHKIIKITHERIANELGTAREVVTRMLKFFQDEGMVALSRGSIEILDSNKLYELSE